MTVDLSEFYSIKKNIEVRQAIYYSVGRMVEHLGEALKKNDFELDENTPEGEFLLAVWKHVQEFMEETNK
jgi:cytochrome c556